MGKDAVFSVKLEPELHADFIAEAEAAHRPASQVVRELMRDYVERQREAREHRDYLQHKVDVARRSVRAGLGRSNDAVETECAARRGEATRSA